MPGMKQDIEIAQGANIRPIAVPWRGQIIKSAERGSCLP